MADTLRYQHRRTRELDPLVAAGDVLHVAVLTRDGVLIDRVAA